MVEKELPKLVKVTHKSTYKTELQIYRPISSISPTAKLFEECYHKSNISFLKASRYWYSIIFPILLLCFGLFGYTVVPRVMWAMKHKEEVAMQLEEWSDLIIKNIVYFAPWVIIGGTAILLLAIGDVMKSFLTGPGVL